jgi:MFS family permease
MIPMSLGFVSAGPVSGWISDKRGARGLASGGMFLLCGIFLTLTSMPYDFSYPSFAGALYLMGIAFGMFASPNTSSIMGTVPPERRSTAAGMLFTLQNTGTTVGLTVLFTEVVSALSASLPNAISSALANAGAAQLAPYLSSIPPTIALFAAFLGYNPMQELIARLPSGTGVNLSTRAVSTITTVTWFPNAIAPSFMGALHLAFYLNAGLAIVAALASLMRGKKKEYEHSSNLHKAAAPIPTIATRQSKGEASRLNADGSNSTTPSVEPTN